MNGQKDLYTDFVPDLHELSLVRAHTIKRIILFWSILSIICCQVHMYEYRIVSGILGMLQCLPCQVRLTWFRTAAILVQKFSVIRSSLNFSSDFFGGYCALAPLINIAGSGKMKEGGEKL